jgi:hypothetical protein
MGASMLAWIVLVFRQPAVDELQDAAAGLDAGWVGDAPASHVAQSLLDVDGWVELGELCDL